MEFNLFCVSATHDRKCFHERENKIIPFSGIQKFKFEEQANIGNYRQTKTTTGQNHVKGSKQQI